LIVCKDKPPCGLVIKLIDFHENGCFDNRFSAVVRQPEITSGQSAILAAGMYRLVRSLLFRFDAESVHRFSMASLHASCSIPGVKSLMQKIFCVTDPGLEREAFGLVFPNPVGLAAGFDKDARHLRELALLGFGSVEIGTVTPRAQSGNPKPRLFRLPADRALINRMGFNNEGVEAVASRLEEWRRTHPMKNDGSGLVIGGNIGKNKDTPNEEAWKDYETCFRALHLYVDYFVVNVSSPNTPGLRELQGKESLTRILGNLREIGETLPTQRPLLLKIAPDLTDIQLDEVVDLALDLGIDGLVAANTTLSREGLCADSVEKSKSIGAGGLSGAPLSARSLDMLKRIRTRSQGRLPVISSGGVFTAEDAMERLDAGACLVQVWTGFVYEGPATASRICKGLLKKD
jgi:dihydroorotate dehydrogenase